MVDDRIPLLSGLLYDIFLILIKIKFMSLNAGGSMFHSLKSRQLKKSCNLDLRFWLKWNFVPSSRPTYDKCQISSSNISI